MDKQLEALEKIKEEYPELQKVAEQMLKDGSDLVEFLSILDSFY